MDFYQALSGIGWFLAPCGAGAVPKSWPPPKGQGISMIDSEHVSYGYHIGVVIIIVVLSS